MLRHHPGPAIGPKPAGHARPSRSILSQSASGAPRARQGIATAVAAGLRYVVRSRDIVRVLVRAAVFGLAAGALPALMPLIAKRSLGGDALVYGVMLGAFGVGSVVGAMIAIQVRAARFSESVVAVATSTMAIGAVGVALSSSLSLTLPALFVAGAGWVAALSTFNVLVQLSADRAIVGRVIAIYQMASFGGTAVGAWAFGRLAEAYSVETALLSAGMLQAAGMLLYLPLPLPSIDDDRLAASGDRPDAKTGSYDGSVRRFVMSTTGKHGGTSAAPLGFDPAIPHH